MIQLSTSKELERLRSTRIELEEESRSLAEKQKNLEERVKVLEENVAVEELENSNKATREAISQLESKINGLEHRLKEVSKVPETPEPTFGIKSDVAAAPVTEQVTPETVEPILEETTGEETVTVTPPLEEPIVAGQEEYGENLKKQYEKKKRRYF